MRSSWRIEITVPMVDRGLSASVKVAQASRMVTVRSRSGREVEGGRTTAHPAGDAFHLLHEMSHEIVVDLVMDDETRPRDARLARGDEAREGSTVRGRLHVRIIEDHDWGFAAELGCIVCEVPADNAADRATGVSSRL